MTTTVFRLYELPWTPDPAAEARFQRISRRLGLTVLLLCLLVPWLPLPEKPVLEPVPERYARLLLERKAPPAEPQRREVEVPPQPVAETETRAEPRPEAKPEKTVTTLPPSPETRSTDAPSTRRARDRAAAAGVMKFAGALAGVRSSAAVGAVKGDGGLVSGTGAAEVEQRNLVSARSGQSSGGVNDSELSSGTGGKGIGGRDVSGVGSPVSGLAGATGGKGASSAPGGGGGLATRSREEIELVFDQNKSALYALYSRALRRSPALSGKLVLELTIAPDGTVTDCRVVESQLDDPDFERRIVARVKMFRFQAKDVAEVTASKPLDFFPSSA